MKTTIDTLVFSGGGIRGMAYCGVLRKLQEVQKEDNGIAIDVKTVCCVSVGSIFGLGYVLGFDADEMQEELLQKDFGLMKSIRLSNLLNKFGLDSGRRLVAWFETMMIKKGVSKTATFQQLFEKTGIKLQVLATNLSRYEYGIFDHVNTPNLRVTKAIKMSISVPFLFTAEVYEKDMYVDGAVINNYPIELFRGDLSNVLGFKLVAHGELREHKVQKDINEFDAFAVNVLFCMMIQKERHTTLAEEYREHTMFIDTHEFTSFIDYDISNEDKQLLIKIGYEAADAFFVNQFSNCGLTGQN
jgi:predicted acylesterase/phospholipase RssA